MPHDFAHAPDLSPTRWSMLAYVPGQPVHDLEYNFRATTAQGARAKAAFETEWAKRTHVKVRQPRPLGGQVIYDGPASAIRGRGQGW